jgi:type IV pilus assembly protein PilE
MNPRRTIGAGFSLVELLIAMAIVGILASIALPGYTAALTRATRNEARLALLRIEHAQERYYVRHLAYTSDLGNTGLATGALSEGRNYQLALTLDANGQSYVATASAVPGGRQASDAACATFRVDETGRRSATDIRGVASECWR